MTGSVTLGHVRGIPVRAHFTLLFVLPYLAFLMAARFSLVARQAGVSPEGMSIPPIAWGLLLAVLLFACVLAHELGHSLVALATGGRVSAITLMLLGGVSELHGLPKTPRVEGLVAVTGPLVSLALGLGALGVHRSGVGPADLRFGLYYLGQINVVLAIFNLLPAFPMDGGRVLRAVLATRLQRDRATQWAANLGKLFAGLFVVVGLLAGNLLLALIGLFVWAGASAEAQSVRQEERLRGLFVRDVMSPTKEVVYGSEPALSTAARMAHAHATALPVVEGSRLIGVVAAHHLEAIPAAERGSTPTAAVTARDVPRLHADEPLDVALSRMAEQQSGEAPVLEAGEIVGVLEANDLGRALRMHELARATGLPGRPPLRAPEAGGHVLPWRDRGGSGPVASPD
jgi:Zn-dependent protease/CBS domain-containing protein